MRRGQIIAIVAGATIVSVTSTARGDDAAPPPVVAPDAPSASTASASHPVASPAASPGPGFSPAPVEVAAKPRVELAWHERLTLGAFVDTYYSHNWRSPRPGTGSNTYHPFNPNTGFGLAWIGLDAAMAPDPVGATLQLRFGPSVPNLALGDAAIPGGIGFIQNGYVSFRPGGSTGKLTILFGKFDTVYGAEVAQSHLNINYTRGALYNLAQPFFHTGARAELQATETLALKVLAVNGWNNTLDNNRGKSFGGQVSWTPSDAAALSLGYMGGPEENDVNAISCGAGEVFQAASSRCTVTPGAPADAATSGKVRNVGAESRWRHLADVVADLRPTRDLRVVVNGTYVTQTIAADGADRSVRWYGGAVLGRYALSPVWALAARSEIVRDANGQVSAPNTSPLTLYTETLTLEFIPSSKLILRVDNRIDAADADVFGRGLNGMTSTQLTTTLGVVAKTD